MTRFFYILISDIWFQSYNRLKNRGSARKRLNFYKFSNESSYNFFISLVQNILVLDESRKPVSYVKVDHENKKNVSELINSL